MRRRQPRLPPRRARRPAKEWDVPGVEPPPPTRLGEVPWLEPLPDAVLDEAAVDATLGPEVRYGQTESLTFVAASALKRARANLEQRRPNRSERQPPPACGSASEQAIVARFVRAYESADLDGLVALLTDDVFMSMPPMPFEYEGRELVARFCAMIPRRGAEV
jgi:hypothetical protein